MYKTFKTSVVQDLESSSVALRRENEEEVYQDFIGHTTLWLPTSKGL